MFPSLQDLIIFQGTLMMFKKIFPLVFAAAAHATPAEAVEPIYVGEPTKKLARQAARCGGVLTVAGTHLGDSHRTAKPELFLKFAIRTIEESETESLAGLQMRSYNDTSPILPRDRRLRADFEVCTNKVFTGIAKNEAAQNLATCAGTADAARVHKLGVGGDHTKISGELAAAAAIDLGDIDHAAAIVVEKVTFLTQAGPSATQAAIQRCQTIFSNSSYIFRFALKDLASGTNRELAAPLTGPEIK